MKRVEDLRPSLCNFVFSSDNAAQCPRLLNIIEMLAFMARERLHLTLSL